MQRPTPSRGRAGSRARRSGVPLGNGLLLVSLLALLGVAAVYLLFVHTAAGQRFEETALAGAREHRGGSWYDEADRWLSRVTAESFAVSLAVIAAVGILRRRWMLALCGVLVAAGATLFSSLLKNALPPRPDLVDAYEQHNTLPSGTATATMSLFFAILIVVSARWYPLATLLVLPGAAGSCVATVAAHWHRMSDTFAADLVALAAAASGLALMAYLGLIRPSPTRSTTRTAAPPRRVWPLIVPVAVLALAATAAGFAYLDRYNAAFQYSQKTRDAYWSAQAFSLGAALAAAAVMILIAYRVEAIPRPGERTGRRTGRRARDPISAASPVRA